MRHFRRWGAVYVLVLLFLGSWLGQFFTQMVEFTSEQSQHGQEFAWSDFLPSFFASTFENWQSEWFQLVFQAILLLGAKHLLFQADAEDLERIERKLDNVGAAVGARDISASKDEPGDPSAIDSEQEAH
ncbi:DUF6766 family protein [Flindersiella endophytica]